MTKILDCGHAPIMMEPGDTTGNGSFNGKTCCRYCMEQTEEFYFGMADKWTGYLTGDVVTTWTGKILARVTYRSEVFNPIGQSKLVFINAVEDKTGIRWYGKGPGDGMYIKLHRSLKKGRA